MRREPLGEVREVAVEARERRTGAGARELEPACHRPRARPSACPRPRPARRARAGSRGTRRASRPCAYDGSSRTSRPTSPCGRRPACRRGSATARARCYGADRPADTCTPGASAVDASAASSARSSSAVRSERRRSSPPSAGPLAITEQRIVARDRREQALGQPADPQAVEVDAQGHPDRSDEHAVAEAADAVARRVELELERSAEHVDRRRRIDGVERAEPVEYRFDAPRRDLLERRPALPALSAPKKRRTSRWAKLASPLHVRGSCSGSRSEASPLHERGKLACAPARARLARSSGSRGVRRAGVPTRRPRARSRPERDSRSHRAAGTGRPSRRAPAPPRTSRRRRRGRNRGRAGEEAQEAAAEAPTPTSTGWSRRCARSGRGRNARAAGGRTARRRRTGPPCARGARPRAWPRRRRAPRRAPRRRDRSVPHLVATPARRSPRPDVGTEPTQAREILGVGRRRSGQPDDDRDLGVRTARATGDRATGTLTRWGTRRVCRRAGFRPRSRPVAASVERSRETSSVGSCADSSATRSAGSRGRRSSRSRRVRVEAVVDRLGTLDAIDPGPTLDVFRRTFELELDAARDRVGRLGDGVLVGPVGNGAGCRSRPPMGVRIGGRPVPGGPARRSPSRRPRPLRCSGARSASVPTVSPTTSAPCSPRLLLPPARGSAPIRARRSAAQYRARPVPLSRRHPRRTRGGDVDPIRSIASFAAGASSCSVPGEPPRARCAGRGPAGEAWVHSEPAGPVRACVPSVRPAPGPRVTRFDGNLADLRGPLERISPASAIGWSRRRNCRRGPCARMPSSWGACAARRAGGTARRHHAARAHRPRHARTPGARPFPRRGARALRPPGARGTTTTGRASG